MHINKPHWIVKFREISKLKNFKFEEKVADRFASLHVPFVSLPLIEVLTEAKITQCSTRDYGAMHNFIPTNQVITRL